MNFLVFIPSGGFTHMLISFGRCLIYSKMLDRKCIPVMCNFNLVDHSFENLFTLNSMHICLESEAPSLELLVENNFPIRRYSDLHFRYSKDIDSYKILGIDSLCGATDYLSLPLDDSFLNEKVVFSTGFINKNWPLSIRNNDAPLTEALTSINLRSDIVHYVKDQFNKLPNRYISVHFRNTDYENDLELAINKLLKIVESTGIKDVHWATDDINSLEIARKLTGINIYSFELNINIHEKKLRNLHQMSDDELNSNNISRLEVAKSFFLDLYCLAKSDYFVHSEKTSIRSLVNLLKSDRDIIDSFYKN